MRIIEALVVLTIFSLPLYIIRCKSFSWCVSPIPFTLLEVFILLSFVSWLVWRVVCIRRGKITFSRLYKRLQNPILLPMLVFWLSATFSIFVSSNTLAAAGLWKAYYFEPLLFFFVVLDLSLEKKSISWVFPPLLAVGAIVAGYGLLQKISLFNNFAYGSYFGDRITSFFDNPNALGMFLSPIVLFTIPFLIRNKFWKKKPLLFLTVLLILAVLGLAIYFSRSRGSIIGLAVSLAVFSLLFLFFPRKQNGMKVFNFLFGLLALFYFLFNGLLILNVEKLIPADAKIKRDSVIARFCIWESTKDIIKDSPLFGSGLSGFPSQYKKHSTCEEFTYQYPHNLILNFWTEVGLLGLVAFLWLNFRYITLLREVIPDPVVFSLLSIIVYTFLHGIVDAPYFKNDLSLQFWLFIAIGVAIYKLKTKPTQIQSQ